MEKNSLGYKIIGVIFIIIIAYLLSIAYNLMIKKDQKNLNIYIKNTDIYFIFNEKSILVYGYEIRSLTERKQNSMEYKKILGKSVEKKISQIILKDYKKYSLDKNHPYYISISREGLVNEPGVVLQSINFCIKDENTIYSNENDEVFIRNCSN